MKYAAVILTAVGCLWTAPALAGNERFYASLKRLDPAKSDVTSHPQHRGDTVKGTGGAFRSKGQWYAFSFTCKGTPDHLKVLSFSYKIGPRIPETKWASYGLWR